MSLRDGAEQRTMKTVISLLFFTVSAQFAKKEQFDLSLANLSIKFKIVAAPLKYKHCLPRHVCPKT